MLNQTRLNKNVIPILMIYKKGVYSFKSSIKSLKGAEQLPI